MDRHDQGLRAVQHDVALAHDANLTQVGICLADQPVAAALVAASERAALLVIGRRDTAAGIYRRSSSVSRHLSRYASCPVVVVPESMQPHDEKRIVLLLNGSAADQAALEFATDHAAVTGAEIEVIEALRTDWPEQDLLNLADHADMVVLPARLPTDDMLGPSEHELVTLRHAPCPVAYAR
jgi:nucleotide-binding universal stress UspA family protein